MLSGVYQYAIAGGIVPKNPVPEAKWLVKVAAACEANRAQRLATAVLQDVAIRRLLTEPFKQRAQRLD